MFVLGQICSIDIMSRMVTVSHLMHWNMRLDKTYNCLKADLFEDGQRFDSDVEMKTCDRYGPDGKLNKYVILFGWFCAGKPFIHGLKFWKVFDECYDVYIAQDLFYRYVQDKLIKPYTNLIDSL